MSMVTKEDTVGDTGEREINRKETLMDEAGAEEAKKNDNPGKLVDPGESSNPDPDETMTYESTAAAEASQNENLVNTDESTGSNNDYASTLEGPNVDEENEESPTYIDAVIEFYKPIKIPMVVYISMSMMIYYEDSNVLERFRYANEHESSLAAKVMLVVFAFWIFGCVHSVIQFCKYVIMLLNKYYKKDLYKFSTSRRPLAVGAMLATKLASLLWTSVSTYYICNENNPGYPGCKTSFSYELSSNLIRKVGCEQSSDYAELLMQIPMIFLTWCVFFTGKIFIPEAIKGFREGEENRLKKLPYNRRI